MKRRLRLQEDLERFCNALSQVDGAVVDLQPGRGEYTSAFSQRGYHVFSLGPLDAGMLDARVKDQGGYGSVRVFPADMQGARIPLRTCIGVWAGESLSGLPPKVLCERLRLAADWLVPQGLILFLVREGEGTKRVAWQMPGVSKEESCYLYQPIEVEEIVTTAGLQTVDAWRTGSPEHAMLHVMARRP